MKGLQLLLKTDKNEREKAEARRAQEREKKRNNDQPGSTLSWIQTSLYTVAVDVSGPFLLSATICTSNSSG
jgi:hypothetical protein